MNIRTYIRHQQGISTAVFTWSECGSIPLLINIYTSYFFEYFSISGREALLIYNLISIDSFIDSCYRIRYPSIRYRVSKPYRVEKNWDELKSLPTLTAVELSLFVSRRIHCRWILMYTKRCINILPICLYHFYSTKGI